MARVTVPVLLASVATTALVMWLMQTQQALGPAAAADSDSSQGHKMVWGAVHTEKSGANSAPSARRVVEMCQAVVEESLGVKCTGGGAGAADASASDSGSVDGDPGSQATECTCPDTDCKFLEASSKLPPQFSKSTTCTAAQKAEQAGDFRKVHAWAKKQSKGWAFGCWAEENTLPALQALRPAKNLVYVDVGANKGQSLSTVLNLWTDVVFHQVLELSSRGPACAFDKTAPNIYAVEPGPGNIELLTALKNKLPKTLQSGVRVVHAAMSDKTGSTCMAGSQEKGNERAGIDASTSTTDKSANCKNGEWKVPMLSLDDFVIQQKISHIDYLKIDTEGFDSAVLFGGSNVFKTGKVTMLSFEYHQIGLWKSRSLKSVVDYLDTNNMDTYFIGDFRLYKLNAGCWDGVYEIKNWSNVFAISRSYQHYDKFMAIYHKTSCYNRDLPHVCQRINMS